MDSTIRGESPAAAGRDTVLGRAMQPRGIAAIVGDRTLEAAVRDWYLQPGPHDETGWFHVNVGPPLRRLWDELVPDDRIADADIRRLLANAGPDECRVIRSVTPRYGLDLYDATRSGVMPTDLFKAITVPPGDMPIGTWSRPSSSPPGRLAAHFRDMVKSLAAEVGRNAGDCSGLVGPLHIHAEFRGYLFEVFFYCHVIAETPRA
jgi:hypothetical protein